jgi:hypothetical protein
LKGYNHRSKCTDPTTNGTMKDPRSTVNPSNDTEYSNKEHRQKEIKLKKKAFTCAMSSFPLWSITSSKIAIVALLLLWIGLSLTDE